jgi:hypothetical protein
MLHRARLWAYVEALAHDAMLKLEDRVAARKLQLSALLHF